MFGSGKYIRQIIDAVEKVERGDLYAVDHLAIKWAKTGESENCQKRTKHY
ncbi:MAG: hypothetical protein EZS26_001376 [Candidatus Ordinivivax streblomastigis]|uniref:Uncharacterized protein n=1 Tax=Candidatus Ordinivivax streblomastigis TaxID=2540710 RepID=A0A5M8P2C7_9BACT|nr:MAG: hypothetical protein EZS26_001376 [Candidatus Ordinivivax streblomastigis]